MINFNIPDKDFDTVLAIANRASNLAATVGVEYTKQEAMMDVTACIANGCPLKLVELYGASGGDFAHDVFGIRRHLDRTTGKLGDCFVPRYAALSVPYPEHCHRRSMCAGKSSCQRDPNCID